MRRKKPLCVCKRCDGAFYDLFEEVITIDNEPYHRSCAVDELVNPSHKADIHDFTEFILSFENTEFTSAGDFGKDEPYE